jgi:hypothetical protein
MFVSMAMTALCCWRVVVRETAAISKAEAAAMTVNRRKVRFCMGYILDENERRSIFQAGRFTGRTSAVTGVQ